MELKKYQQDVLDDIKGYVSKLYGTYTLPAAFSSFWNDKGVDISSLTDILHPYDDSVSGVPKVTVKVPTAGGKTFIACNAIYCLTRHCQINKAKVVAWFVPSDTILKQTYMNLSNPSHPYRQKLDSLFGHRVLVVDKEAALLGQGISPSQIAEQTTIFVLSVQSFATANKEGRRSYRENENLSEYTHLYSEMTTKVEGADDSALIQVLAYLHPIVIIDESHNFTADLRIDMLKAINPCFILELTATPRNKSNIISFVDAIKLKRANMVKLPVIVYNQRSINDVIISAIQLQKNLEKKAILSEQGGGKYIRPIVLFQAQPRTDEDNVTFDKIKRNLLDIGIPTDQIKIKTAERDELKNVNLLDKDCPVRFIITVNALKEGWDCPFAYILASLANRTSKIDVEQILGRILRLPYTTKNADELLNLSYVFTSSNDFRETIENIIISLNRSGFSRKDFRVPDTLRGDEYQPEERYMGDIFANEHEELEVTQDAEEEVNPQQIRESLDSCDLSEIEASAIKQSDDYNQQLSEISETDSSNLSAITDMVTQSTIKDIYLNDAKDVKIPSFYKYLRTETIFDKGGVYNLLQKESLEEGFSQVLNSSDKHIDFTVTDAEGVRVDLEQVGQGEHDVKQFKLSSEQDIFLRHHFETLAPDALKRTLVNRLVSMLKSDYHSITEVDLHNYILGAIESLSTEKVSEVNANILSSYSAARDKIDRLLIDYRKNKFDEWLDKGIIKCIHENQYRFPDKLTFTKELIGVPKGLYTHEEYVNDFEKKVITDVANLDSVRYWHRNMDRGEGFCINGYIYHYPDFIIKMNSGLLVLLETKGDHLDNDDSRIKRELGYKWASCAGSDFRYYMVFDKKDVDGALTFKKFIDRLQEM